MAIEALFRLWVSGTEILNPSIGRRLIELVTGKMVGRYLFELSKGGRWRLRLLRYLEVQGYQGSNFERGT